MNLAGILDQIVQEAALRLQGKTQAPATLQVKGHRGLEGASFHGRTSLGQGWATARSMGRLTLAYT